MTKDDMSAPLLCRIFGHKWATFDKNWCGTDYQMCKRIGLVPFRRCGATRGIPSELRPLRKRPSMTPLVVSGVSVLVAVILSMGAAGRADDNRVKASCARHHMAPNRVGLGRSSCIDEKTGQLRYFADVK